MQALRIRAIAFRERSMWCAQCLEHDIAVQAEDVASLSIALRQALADQIEISRDLGGEPFATLPPAPDRYFAMYEAAEPTNAGTRAPDPLGTIGLGDAFAVAPDLRLVA